MIYLILIYFWMQFSFPNCAYELHVLKILNIIKFFRNFFDEIADNAAKPAIFRFISEMYRSVTDCFILIPNFSDLDETDTITRSSKVKYNKHMY
ncbi:hypothetical protein SAMN05444380_11467 [Thermophagus xiamenensis]|uniref:Uncharacterized protein n=1 Tax=Thermophagus xiamenensis TaxID=385682 RepID=A0A1I2BXN1_9BACT|nr:hypothetical protein SAMN05444380_11467 [Thermophagus xiamenensis]